MAFHPNLFQHQNQIQLSELVVCDMWHNQGPHIHWHLVEPIQPLPVDRDQLPLELFRLLLKLKILVPNLQIVYEHQLQMPTRQLIMLQKFLMKILECCSCYGYLFSIIFILHIIFKWIRN